MHLRSQSVRVYVIRVSYLIMTMCLHWHLQIVRVCAAQVSITNTNRVLVCSCS